MAGRRKDGWIPEVRREAAAVEAALADEIAAQGWTVTPVICVHRADSILTPADVERLAALADTRLRRALGAAPVARVAD